MTKDGQRFLMIQALQEQTQAPPPPAHITVVLNWLEDLKRLVPAN